MNRTRCVQFYWRRFARVIKYSSSVTASRLIKKIYRDKVNKIWRQYKVFKFRNTINLSIKNKKARLI